MRVAILTIGDEILYGQTLDTNSHWMSRELDKYGFSLVYKATVGDNEEDILKGLDETSSRAEIILITGGLGPTADDLTKPCLAKYFKVELEPNLQALEELKAIFKQINIALSQANIEQTNLPSNSIHISNSVGTAPGIWIEENNKVFISMPGVPFEMKAMLKNEIIPKLQEQFHLPSVVHKVVRTIGIGESWLAKKIADWEHNLPEHIGLAYLPSIGQVKLRLTSSGLDKEKLHKGIDEQIKLLKPLAHKYIYGYDDDEIQEVLGDILRSKKLTVGTAESCTGGYLAHLLTIAAGSSDYFKGSIIAYTNEIKLSQLGVSKNTLKKHGAVSEEAIIEMARGVQKKLNVDIGLATSGIAGPGGGSEEKPVGMIWIAVAINNEVHTRMLSLFKDRVLNIKTTATANLAFLWRILTK